MAAPKKSSFWHTRKNIIPNNEAAAQLLGVDVSEIERMDKEGAPAIMERYILLWDKKHVGDEDWRGWMFSRGALIHKNMRWRPEHLLHAHRETEMIGELKTEIYKLNTWKGVAKTVKKLISKRKWSLIYH